jgi:deferrochelatase/peroxidase EfeB
MVGRKKDGDPLETTRDSSLMRGVRADPQQKNSFTFRADPRGLRCPLGAHIRRVNPRNADMPPGPPGILSRLWRILGFDADALAQDLVASTRFHRLVRRGRKYEVGTETGLHFICLAGNITRQFEFVQSAWVMGTKFDGLPDEADALLGSRQKTRDGQPTDGYSIPQAGSPDMRLSGLPPFVTVLGGAYFFMPGIRALRYLATAR